MIQSREPQNRTSSRRSAERETRRQYILDAARALLEEKRIEEIRMEDIAAAAEYTRRTLYAYFPGRDDIWLRVHVTDLSERWARQQQALERMEGGPARIRAWAEALYAFWKERPNCRRVEQYWDFHGIDRKQISADLFEQFEALNEELADGLREVFQSGIEDGSLRSDLQVDACISQFIYSTRAVLGRALSSSFSFADVNPDQYVQQFLDLFLRGIRRES
ncbi:MAG: TetR/AcrR family transcriptional regulator [Planctomycetota bacterium]